MGLSVKRPARFPPRKPRAAVAIDAWLLLPDDEVAPIEVRNISTDGFMGEAPVEISPGTSFGIVMPGCGIVRASVCWSEDGEIGGQFRRPLSVERLEGSLGAEADSGGFLDARIRQMPLGSLPFDPEEV